MKTFASELTLQSHRHARPFPVQTWSLAPGSPTRCGASRPNQHGLQSEPCPRCSSWACRTEWGGSKSRSLGWPEPVRCWRGRPRRFWEIISRSMPPTRRCSYLRQGPRAESQVSSRLLPCEVMLELTAAGALLWPLVSNGSLTVLAKCVKSATEFSNVRYVKFPVSKISNGDDLPQYRSKPRAID